MSYPVPTTPYIKTTREKAYQVNRQLVPTSGAGQIIHRSNYPIVEVEIVTFGYQIPFLPNFVHSQHLSGSSDRERVNEALDRQSQIVANLSKWKGISFALRYLVKPQNGEICIQLLVKVRREVGAARKLGELVLDDLISTFNSLDIPLEAIKQSIELDNFLLPFSSPYILQIAQREELVPIRVTQNSAYVVYPYRRPTSTWIQTLELLVRQKAPVLISIQMEPTQLFDYESSAFSDLAAKASNWADYPVFNINGHFNMTDPLAGMVGRLHEDYLRRFSSPNLMAIYVCSPDETACYAAAQAIGSDITEKVDIERSFQSGYDFPSGFDIFMPANSYDVQRAQNDIRNIDISSFGMNISPERHISRETIPPGKERLRFLVNVQSGSSAFRFPIPIRGGLPGIKTIQQIPTFDDGPRKSLVKENEIYLGEHTVRGGKVTIPLKNICRHVLVAGTTGSGKTTSCFQILSQLWEKGVPFLVIEPANTNYRSLIPSSLGKDLKVFTLGDETISPFRLNPLEMLPGITVEKHISSISTCIDASIPTFGILPSLIKESLETVYSDRGWELTDKREENDDRRMPTLGDLYHAIIKATEGRQYSRETFQDIRAAASGRIGSLLRGSHGRMLNTSRSIPFQEIMKFPTILELEAVDKDEDKALVMMFLLTMIREYCRANYRKEEELHHVTVIEEAHRLLQSTPHSSDREITSDARATAVQMFNSTLSEIRTFGEGIIIAEQNPYLLSINALANTNTKIIHQLPAQEDREAVVKSINATQDQETFILKLEPGYAAFFMQGSEQATFIKIPDYRNDNGLPGHIDDSEVINHMDNFNKNDENGVKLPFYGCSYCLKKCRYRDRIDKIVYDVDGDKKFRTALYQFQKNVKENNRKEAWKELVSISKESLATIDLDTDPHAYYCYFSHLWAYPISEQAAQLLRELIKDGGN